MINPSAERIKRMCTLKRRFPFRELAEAGAMRTERDTGVPMKVYACPVCGEWHVASKKPRGNS